jgi:hypothetical protein
MLRLTPWGTPPITHRAEPPTKHPWNPELAAFAEGLAEPLGELLAPFALRPRA